MKTAYKVAEHASRRTALIIAFAVLFGISTRASAGIIHLPPGTANSGAIPIGSGAGEAPTDKWSFVPFSDTSCGDPGTRAGIDFYPSSTANKDHLLIFFQGGGYCYDYNTCYNMRANQPAPGFGQAVWRLNGFSASAPVNITILRNNNASDGNPFTDWSKVFVWYCTGDIHSGDNIVTYKDPAGGTHKLNHVGYANAQKYLSRLKTTFCSGSKCTMPAPSQIVVAGGSAGGWGSVWNLQQVADKFGMAGSDVQLIDDSGPYLRRPYWTASLQGKMAKSWWGSGTSTRPEACAHAGNNCDPRFGGQFNAMLGDLQLWFPMLRASLITGMADSVISGAFSRLTFGPPDNQPPYSPGPCGSAYAGDCLPDGYPGLVVDPFYELYGYFCTRALPDYTANQPGGFKTFEVTVPQTSSGTTYEPSHHQWLNNIALNHVHAIDGTLLSDFLSDQLRGTGPAWANHVYTFADAAATCSGWSF